MINHKDNLLTSVLNDANPFSATTRCVSRIPETTVVQPFKLFYQSESGIPLDYDSVFAQLQIVGLSLPNTRSFTSGTTDIRCAVKVGGGYSTNNACLRTACVGGTCAAPQTFSVVNSGNYTCTTDPESEYDIGCNPLADNSTKIRCAEWFRDAFEKRLNPATNTFNAIFTFGGGNTPISCRKYPEGTMPGGMNMYANYVCTTLLRNGEEVTVIGYEDNLQDGTSPLQTTAYTTKKDNEKPAITPIAYYSSASLSPSSLITNTNQWQKGSVTAVVTCTDAPGVSDGDTCACAPSVDPTTTHADLWSSGSPDGIV